jgi:hypothetical protein
VCIRRNPVGIPIIPGASEKVRRTGGTFRSLCPRCDSTVKMYEAVKHTNVSAFFAISLWNGADPVVQCGECLGVFGDEDATRLRAAAGDLPPPRIGALFSSLLLPSRQAPAPKRTPIDESAIDAELP